MTSTTARREEVRSAPVVSGALARAGAAALLLALGGLAGAVGHAAEPIVGGPCEGCENVFVDLPEQLDWRSRIAPTDEPGEPLAIEGTVRSADGSAAPGIIVYAYHTDARGVYPPATTSHGRLRGWARTDANGRYRFDTIRPAAYPQRTAPQHVHMHVIEPGQATYYIDDIVFDDDPLLTPGHRRRMLRGRGGSALARPEKDSAGVWLVRRDITLGKDVPGYARRNRSQ